MPLNFLLTSRSNPGNLNPFLRAARRLRRRGHRVRILDTAAHRQETTKAGFESLSWLRPTPIQPARSIWTRSRPQAQPWKDRTSMCRPMS
jgi:UDP:flavonoid glycosyltransferase YjiC (YdhE family)